MSVLLIGTLDTKGTEFAFVREMLRQAGFSTVMMDAAVLGPSRFEPDLSREQVYAAGGSSYIKIRSAADRGLAIATAAEGAAVLTLKLHLDQQLEGVLGLGGSAGTTIATAAMRVLPFGIPKVMVSTLASGQVRPYVGVRDITMMHSVVDLSGLNRISRVVLTQAVGALIGMIRARQSMPPCPQEKPLLTATMFGVTTPCVESARVQAESAGYEVLIFHATGIGGLTMESFLRDGLACGVLDLTTTELADELVGGVLSAGPDRLTAAGLRGVPQVLSLGALDMVNFGPRSTVPQQFQARRFYQHNPNVTLMRTTPEENDQLGKEIAHKASAARGPTAVLIPLRGVSALDAKGQPFWWPEADQVLFQSLRNWMSPHVKLIEVDQHINDPEFANSAVRTLLGMLRA